MLRRAHATRPLRFLAATLAACVAVLVAAGSAAADATAPTITFGTWAESSPYAHYDGTADENRLWFNPDYTGSATATIVAKDPETGVAHLAWPTPPTGWSPAGSNDTAASDLPGILGNYFSNATANSYPGANNFQGVPIARIDPDINFLWGAGSPHPGIPVTRFNARWTGKITAPENGTYYFQASSNDGMKVRVNGVEVLSFWTDTSGVQDRTQCSGGINLVAGTKYDIVVEYYENNTPTAAMQLRWRLPVSNATTHQVPAAGCDTTATGSTPTVRENYANNGMTGPGVAQYPIIPASAFTVGGGGYTRTFTWNTNASGGTVNATAINNDAPQDTSVNAPIEFVADNTGPVAGGTGSLDFSAPGWGTTGANTLVFPRADTNITDAGASASNWATITRVIERRDGVANGFGGCDTSAGSWVTVGTPASNVTTYSAPIPSAGVCSEFRYRLTDAVGNRTDLYASGFRGWDGVDPLVTVTSITEGTNPQYQYVSAPNAMFYNGNQSGTFDVTATPTDAHSGPYRIQFVGRGPAAGANNLQWLLPDGNADAYDPGPWTTTYSWNASSQNLGNERITVWDYAGQNDNPVTHSITRDVTGPGAGTMAPTGTTWRSVLSVPVNMSAGMTDAGAGVYSYQLQREETALNGTTCDPFTGVYAPIGAPVYGAPTPPPNVPPLPITGVTDSTGIADSKCYRYRVEATDNVGNIGYLANGNTVRIDDTNPSAVLNAVPAVGSGNITLGGSATDDKSGVASVSVRLEDLSAPGPTTPLYTDNSVAPNWGNYTWVTTALNGNYRLHIDVTDVAGNVATSVVTHDILLDNTVPTIVHTGFTEGAGADYQYIDPVAANHRIFFNSNAPSGGDFLVNMLPDDPESGIDFVTFANVAATGWTPSAATQVQDPGPYSYSFAWANGAAAPNAGGVRSATATSNSNKVSTPANFTITRDINAPGAGGAGAVAGTIAPQPTPGASWHIQPSIVLNLTNYVEASTGAGIAEQRIERDEVPRNASGMCNSATWPNAWTTVIGTPGTTLPATVTDSSIVHGICYRYRIRAIDHVGNVATTNSAPTPIVPDLVAPIATFNTAAPTSPYRGTETLTGTTDDGITDGSNSGIASVTLRWLNLDDSTSGTIGTDNGAYPGYSIAWNTNAGGTPDGNYRIFVDVRDVATNEVLGIVTHDVIVDNSPPVVALHSFVKGAAPACQYWSGLPSTTFWYSSAAAAGCAVANDFTAHATATDDPGGVNYVQFPVANMNANNITPDAPVAPNVTAGRDTTAAPTYEWHYTYGTTVGSPALEYISAMGNQGWGTVTPPATPPNTPHVSANFNEDNTGPANHTITGPGGAASPAWWSKAASPSVAFDVTLATDAGAGVKTGAHVLERRDAPAAGANCGAYGPYAPVGTTGLATPYSDGSTPENFCYQYRIVAYDNVSNPGTVTSPNHVRIDRTLPTGTINPVPAYVRGTTVALSGASVADNWAGVASIEVRLGTSTGTNAAGTCSAIAVGATWNCTWDTTAAPNGATTLVLVVTDRAGNVHTQTQPTYVDNELPATGVTIAAGTNAGAQFVVPGPTPRIYVNTKAGSDGDFTVTTTPTDGFSGVANVSYPAFGTNWTRTPAGGVVANPGPYVLTYAWTGGATTADPGAGQLVQVADNAANFNTAPFDVVADITGPTGVTLDYADGPTPTPSVDFDEGADTPGSGLATWRIERRETAVTGPNTCDTTWSIWTTEATAPALSPWTDGSVVLNRCYQYRIVSTDNVGNETIVADATNDTVTIEPSGIIVVENGGGPSTDVTEGGATDTYTVRLRTRPSANVTVTLGSDDQVDTNAPSLLFTTATWNVAQTVTVTATDDDVDEVPDPHTGTITHVAGSTDGDYDTLAGASVVANVTDDDVSAFVVSPTQASVAVLEAGATSDTYTIRLQSEPTADVVVTLGNGDGEVTFSPATLTFTDSTWSTDQTVTITAVDDDYDEVPDAHTGVVTHAVASGDPLYAPLTIADTTAAVTDDDAAGVTVTPTSGLSVEEGDPATDSYDVVLDSEPVGTVTVNLTVDATNGLDASVSSPTLTFDQSSWDTPQQVDVSAVQDPIVEGPHGETIAHTATAPHPADTAYGSVAISPVSVGVVDDDVPGIEVTPTSGLTATEGGAGSSYQVRLESEPTADVTIAFGTGTQLDPITSLVFTPVNWNSYQTVNVAAAQDDIDEVPDPHTGTIVHTVTSPDGTYAGWALANQSVAITDDDQAAITVDELGVVDVDEANLPATDTFTVVLESEPVGTVTVTPNPDAQVTTSGAVTFTSADWSVPKVITVTAVDDDIDEADPHTGSVTLDVTGDPLYDALNPAPVDADVADDDTAALVISPGVLALDEDLPASDTFTVRLQSEPVSPVIVTITPDTQSTTGSPTLTFTALNWNIDQTVTISAVDDPMVEDDPHPTTVGVDATAGDPGYVALAPSSVAGSIADNDVPGVTINEGGGVDVTEGTGTDSYTVVLDRQPQADVVVTVAADTQVIGLPTTLTFTTLDWNVAQVVTVTAVDDDIDEGTGTHPGGFTHTVASSDPRWSTVTTAAPVAVDVTDDDVAGVTVTASSPYALDEDTPAPGTTVTYDVVLNSEPTAAVDIDLTVPGDLTASPTTLSFDASNWDDVQTVTVGAIDDLVTELPGPVHTRTITHAITTGDAFYGPASVADVAFDVTDNDIPGIVVSETSLTATEGGADDTFTVVLETQPAADVIVDLTGTQVGFDVDPLTFTSGNWNVPQVVTVSATNDVIDEHPDTHPGLVELDVTGDPVYAGWALADIPVAITDNDDAGVTITPGATAIAVAEAGTTSATYTVVLDTEPTASVTVTPTVGDGQTTVSGPLVFTTANWNVPQSVTVTAVDDPDDEAATHPGFVTHAASSGDTHYDATLTIDQQAVDIADDDMSSVTVTPTSGLTLDEAVPGTTATFSVVLASRPIGDVDVTFATTDGQTTVAPNPITFTPANWNAAQNVTVTVVDDDVDEAASHGALIEVDAESSVDALYDAFDPADVTASIADDDAAGVHVVESGGTTDVDEAGTTDSYAVRLQSQPTADVTIDITGGLDATTTPVQLTFTTANWNVDQTVTVTGTPDFFIEGVHDQTITHAITAGDATYVPALPIANVVAHVTDNDTAGATITPTTVDVAEGVPGVTDTYDVVLDAEPTADVTITLTPSNAEVLLSTPSLVFTPANWNATQTVTVSANDDLVVEATPHTSTIQHAMTSPDTDFNVAVADVNVNIADNDVPGVTVTPDPANLSVTEGGAGSSFTVELDSVPTANVDVTFSANGQLVAMPNATFTPGNWNVPQTITVAAFNDFVAEGAHASQITLDTASTDTYYEPGDLTIIPVDVDIADDDVAGVLVAPNTGLAGSEGGANVPYDVSLTSQPTGTVTIALAGDADGAPVPTTLTFDGTDWATPKPVDVAIVEDAIAEGAHTTTITHDVSAVGDSTYDTAVTVPDQSVAISDNDTAGVVFTPNLPGPLAIGEGGPDGSYTVHLTSEPTGDVTIDIASLAGEATPTPSTLTFTSADWMTPQSVTVVADDDQVAETTPHTDSLTHTAGGADTTYAGLALGDMDLDIDDDDTPAVFIDATLPGTSVAEGGLGDTVRVRLGTEPTAPVTVTLSSTQVTLGATTLTFTPANWNTPQDVTVDAIQDDVFEGPHAGTIDALTGSIGDSFYAGVAATQHAVTIADDDTAGVIVTPAAPNTLDETTPLVSRTYSVRLESEPLQPVDVTVTADPQVDTGATTTLTFAPGAWNVDQTVTVTPVDDAVSEATPHTGAVAHDTVSMDAAYGAGVLTIDPAEFDITDNDTPGITITPTAPHAVTEGGATSSYDIVLDSQPTADVTIAPIYTQLEWTVPNVTFTSTNWNTPQTVTLRAVDDDFDEPDPHTGTLVHSVTAGDAGYLALVPSVDVLDVTADITDNDTSDLVATPVGAPSVDEAGALPAAQYVLTLTSEPTDDVTVTLGTPAPAQVSFLPATVTLTSANWSTGVTVDVLAVQDDVDEASPHTATITHAMSSSDTNFDAETGPSQSVDVVDDDDAGVTITPSGASTDVTEDGVTTDGYDVVLDSQPLADVTITMATPGNQVTATPATLTFTSANWNTPQPVTVTAVQDFVFEGAHTGTITHVASATGDPNYDPTTAPIDDVVANILDDDTPNVIVTPAGGTFEIAEGGATDDLVVTLATDPTSPVTIDVATADADSTIATTQVVLDTTNWNTGVPITVTAFDDGFIEGTHSSDVTFTVDAGASNDPYDTVVVPTQTAQVSDNDSAGAFLDLGDGLALDEAAVGTTDTFSIELLASPTVGETVDVALTELAPGGQVTFSPTSLTFDDTNWSTPQVVTVTVVNDDVDEADPHVGTIEFGVTSTDTDFAAVTIPDADASIADDDTAGLVVTPGTITVAEDTPPTSQVVNVKLQSQPIGDVTVTVAGDAQVDATATLTFTPANWSVDQPVTVTAVQDLDDEAQPHTGHVTFDIASTGAPADPTYDALATVDRTVDVTDDDTSDVLISAASGPNVDEATAATTVTWDVELATRPSGDVTVTLVPDAQLEVVGATMLTFTQADWMNAKTIEVRAADDDVDEAPTHPGLLAFTMGGADPLYGALTPTALSIDVLDDDSAGVSITPGPTVPAPLDEAGTLPAATYDVELLSEPIAGVDVTLATPGSQVDTGGTTVLSFDASNWDDAQTVTVTAVDDAVTETDPHPGVVTHSVDSVGDPAYATAAALTIADADFTITDDDQPGFTLNPIAPTLTVLEAGATSQTYTLSINTEPAGPVTVNFASSSADATVAPASHVFDSTNFTTPVTITVTAADDTLVDPGETVTITHALDPSSHAGYALAVPAITIPDVLVDVTDDEVAGLAVVDGGGVAVAEAGETTGTFTVALTAEPSSAVVIDVAEAVGGTQLDDDGAPVTPATLTFTPGDWDDPQTVTVQPEDDALIEADPHAAAVALTVDAALSADEFDATTHAAVPVSIDDDDVPAIVITDPADMTMSEDDAAGSARDFIVRLATQPTTPVIITASHDYQVAFTASPTISLDSTNYATGVPVSVQVAVDEIDEADPHPGTLTFTVAPASDPDYAGLPAQQRTVSITDAATDVAAVSCADAANWNDTSGRLQMAEDPTDSYHAVSCDVTLGSRLPAGEELTVAVTPAPASQLTASQASVTFTSADSFGATRTLTFTATDDAVAEGTHPATIAFDVSSTNALYDLLSIPTVDVDIADDDTAGITADPAGPIAVTEGAGTETFSVVLRSQPTAPVTISVDGGAQVTATPTTLTFQPATWNVAQQVSVAATDDPVDEADPHPGQVALTVTAGDAGYLALAPTPVDVSITDNDTPSVLVVPSDPGNAVSEAGTTDTFDVRLGTRPSDDVTVTLDPGAQLTTTPATLTFTSGNWNTAQTVTIAAVQDPVVEGEHTGTVAFAIASDDATYGAGTAATPASQAVTITDDDLAGVTIVESDGKTNVGEAGGTDTYTIALSGQPSADVTIAATGGAQVTTAPASLTFTAANWNTPQTVTVSAVQDSIDEPDPHGGEVAHAATTTAVGWTGANVAGVPVSVADDDAANVIATPSAGSNKVIEGQAAGDTISFTLSSQPTKEVSIVAKGDAQVSVSDKPIIFTPEKWKDGIELKVTAVDDEDVEGDHQGTLTFVVSSEDASYKKATTPAITVEVSDNDVDKPIPNTTGEEGEEDDGESTRRPRSSVPPATLDTPEDDSDAGTERRTSDGAGRTDEGRTRTPDGVAGATATGSTNPDGVRTGRRLGGEVVNAAEEEPVTKRRSPVAQLTDWLKDNWLLAALIVGGGTVVAGTGAWLMRGDPIKAAQRAAGAKGAAEAARRAGSKGSHHVRPRRVGKKKKKDDDEDDPKQPSARKPRR